MMPYLMMGIIPKPQPARKQRAPLNFNGHNASAQCPKTHYAGLFPIRHSAGLRKM
jgi:hypothetical protein